MTDYNSLIALMTPSAEKQRAASESSTTRIPLDASAIEALEILGIDPAGKHMVDLPAGSTREEILTLLNGKPSEADVLRIILEAINEEIADDWIRTDGGYGASTSLTAKAVLDALKANGVTV